MILCKLLSIQIMIGSGCIIAADGVGSIENCCKHILLDVADFGCVAAHAIYDILNMLTVDIHKSFSDISHTVRITCNSYLFSLGA